MWFVRVRVQYVFVCLFSVPSKVRELTIIDIKATSIMLSWKPPSENVGDIEVYQIAYHVKEAIDLVPEYLRTTRTNHTVDGLYRSTEYEFRVRTVSICWFNRHACCVVTPLKITADGQ